MLRKMLKHDMRAMWHTAMPMLLVTGIVSVICCGMLYFTFSFAENAESLFGALALVGSFYVIGVCAVFALPIIISVFVLVRYYKSLFSDEGYLTMVLPMESTTLINEKILYTLIWWGIGAASIVLGLFVSVILPIMLYDGEMLITTIEFMESLFGMFIEPGYDTAINILNIFVIAAKCIENAVLTVAAITVGAMVMKRRKLLGAFLFYFGITFVRENVITMVESIADIVLVKVTESSLGIVLALIFSLSISVAITLVSYFVMRNVFTKKFNIE